MTLLGRTYRNRRVVVTGHTGFKGSWLTAWLLKLGADVIGISKDIPTQPAMFTELQLESRIRHVTADVRDLDALHGIIKKEDPDFVFHLAAQAIVSESYMDPVTTVSTNVIGTMNVLESLRNSSRPRVAVLITSDKCYDNVEWVWGYRENDRLGGKDIYSGSKGAAELVIKAYGLSFFQNNHPVRIGIGRAGNVIGGGDWARDRIVADCVRAWSVGRFVEIRSPGATRPWQHVLEPLSGYLTLGAALMQDSLLHGQAFNFGPRAEQNRSVIQLITDLGRLWGISDSNDVCHVAGSNMFHEAGLLKLNCDKALSQLGWEPNLHYEETIRFVADWYLAHYRDRADMLALSMGQIEAYESLAMQRNRTWAMA